MKMKVRISKLTLVAGALLLWGCAEDASVRQEADEELNLSEEVVVEAGFMEMDDLTQAIMEAQETSSGREQGDGRLACATISHDTEAKTIVIDFGEGCEGPDGRIRAGKIEITYTALPRIPGAVVVTRPVDYVVSGVAVEGTRTWKNISDLQNRWPRHSVRLEGGKLTWPDGRFAHREVQLVRTFKPADTREGDVLEVIGWTRGRYRNGVIYNTLVERETPLVFIRNCRVGNHPIPVQGVKKFKVGSREFTVDYGEGTCNREVTVTHNGESRVVQIRLDFM
jgi:hypothetical protein